MTVPAIMPEIRNDFPTLDSSVLATPAARQIGAKVKDVERIGKRYRAGKVCGLSFPDRMDSRLRRSLVVIERQDGRFYLAQTATVDMLINGIRQPEYGSWSNMITRCENPNFTTYHDYGGRGIKVCPRWRRSFKAFLQDMGPRPSAKHSLDRIDNDGNYDPGNCRWATRTEQARNKRNNRILTISASLTEWSTITGVPFRRIHSRIQRGWSEKDAVFTPVGGLRSSESLC